MRISDWSSDVCSSDLLGVAKISLRGIGLESLQPGAEGSIAFHVDGVFISRSVAALASFYDIQQVEVLRGPQGTLYGRNATGGSINIMTRGPTDDLSGYRSEEHTSELKSLMSNSYAVFCLKKQQHINENINEITSKN